MRIIASSARFVMDRAVGMDRAAEAKPKRVLEASTRRVFVYSTLLLLAVVAALGIVLGVDRQVRLRAGERHVNSLAEGMEREVSNEFAYLERGFKGLAADARLFWAESPEATRELLQARFNGVLRRNSALSNLTLTREWPLGAWVPAVGDNASVQSRLYVGAPVERPGVGHVLPLAIPVADTGPGDPVWLTFDLAVSSLERVAARLDVGSNGMANLFHRSGRLIVRSRDQAQWVGTDLADSELFRRHLKRAPRGVFHQASPIDGSNRITAFRTLSDFPLVVVAGVAKDDILRGWMTFALTAGALGLLLALLWLVLVMLVMRTASEQRALLDSLEISAEQLKEAHRIAGLGEWTWNLNRGWITWSEEIFRIHGLAPRPEPLRIEEIFAIIVPEDRPRLEEDLQRMLAGGTVMESEYRTVRSDGSVRTVYTRGEWSENLPGRRILRGTQQDITELAETRQRLRQAQDQYQFLFEQNPLPMWVFDLETLRFLAVNDAAIAHYGYAREEWLGMRASDIRPAGEVKALMEAVNSSDRDRFAGQVWTHLRKDGTTIRVATFGRDIEFEGRPARLILSEDVTERERNEQRFQLIARATSDAVWDWDLVTGVTWRSDNVFALFGYRPGEFGATLGAWSELLHPEDRERVITSILHGIESGAAEWQEQYRLRRSDGTYADVLDRSFILRDAHGKALRCVGGMLDVTEQHRVEADLRLLRRAVEASDNGVVIADARQPDMPLVYVNPAFERLTGYESAEVLGRNCRFLQGGEVDQAEISAIEQAIAEEREVRVLLRNYRKDGELFWNDLYLGPVRDEAGVLTHFVGILSDVTERQAILEQLAYRATFDELTGLPNRQLLSDRLQQAVHSAKRFDRGVGVLFVDLDDFKLINDTLGHSAGDEALRTVAQRLRAAVRDSDTFGRFGGDEFVAILAEQTDEDGVGRVIERIAGALAAPVVIANAPHYVTASIGYTRYPEGGEDAETLLRHADVAMYQAKQQGRNQAVAYRAEFDTGIGERLHLVSALRDALQREEFCLAFQPVFDRDRQAVAVEALVRWRHPERGLLAPGHFIGVCEDSGLIVPLGRWVLRDAARHHAQLAAAGLGHLRIAVNVSAMQFAQDLYADVAAVVREFSLAPGVLELELTESVIMSNPERAVDTIDRLAKLGVGLSVDDFGTGYSSLTYLKRLPIQRLKIDRSFVQDLGVNPDDAAICTSIIGLAHSLGLTTVAEGVETAQQFEWLHAQKCDEMQGYLLGRPEPFEVALALLLANHAPDAPLLL